jgi:hypothetical protein
VIGRGTPRAYVSAAAGWGTPRGMDERTDTTEEIPSGLPSQEQEEQPLGVDEPDPEHQESGPDAMPGIPTDGEPPASA